MNNIYIVTTDSVYDNVREDHYFTDIKVATKFFEKNSGLNTVLSIAVDYDGRLVPGEILRDEAAEREAAELEAAEREADAQAKYWEDLEDYFRRR